MVERFRRNVLTGFLTIIPILVTIWIVGIVLNVLIGLGRPVVTTAARTIRPEAPGLADLLLTPWFQSLVAALVTVVMLALLGAFTKALIGRRLLAAVDALMARIPLVQTVYGAARKLIESFQHTSSEREQRVVLIEFPSPEMKAVGLVTRTFHAADTGQELAAVYVPTTPNPTSGYLEVVPVERLVWLDWSTNQAMQFIISGGTIAPETIRYGPTRPAGEAWAS